MLRDRKSPMQKIVFAGSFMISIAGALCVATPARAFENAKVMPMGVNRMTFRVVNTTISNKTDGAGVAQDLAKPIQKDLTFRDVLKGEKDLLKRELTAGFLLYSGVAESNSLGNFTADLEGRLTVYAPVYSRGITDRLTLAAALPIYDMSMNVGVGYQAGPGASAFRDSLTESYNNQAEGARDFVTKINDAVERLETKLTDNGYKRLEPWQAKGLGDAQLVAKYAVLKDAPVNVAALGGLVLPTGRVDDPDNLIDAGFGDGQWDTFFQASVDQPLGQSGILVNQYAKYTVQWEDKKDVRLKTADESIEVPKKKVNYKLGDKINAGISLQYDGDSGLTTGLGYNYFQKAKDLYDAGESAEELQKDTFQRAHEAEVSVGYSAVPAFRRQQIAVPFEINLNYKHQLASQNMPVTHFVQLETGMFF